MQVRECILFVISMKHFSDQEIIQAILKGNDTEVIESLYANVLPKIKKYVCSNGGSLDDAYDVFQEAIMVFYKVVVSNRFDNEKYKVHGFLHTICKNQWINLIKKRINSQNREQKVETEKFESNVLEKILATERRTAIDQLFNSLGKRCTEILTLFFHEQLSLREISLKLGDMTEDTVKVKSHRCRKVLTEKIRGNKDLIELLRNWA